MSILSARWRFLCAAVVLVISVCSFAQASNEIVLQVKDVPLRDVINLMTAQSGCNIVVSDDIKLDKRISVNLSDVPLEKALDIIVTAAGIGYKKGEDGIYVVGGPRVQSPLLKASDITGSTPAVAARVEEIPAPSVQVAEAPYKESIYTKVTLSYAKPSEVLALLGPDAGAMRSVRHEMRSKYRNFKMHRLNRSQPDIPNDSGVNADNTASRTASGTDGAAQIGGGYGGGNSGSRGSSRNTGGSSNSNYNTSQNTGNNSQYGGSGAAGGSGSMFVPDGIEDVRAFDIDNSLLIKGDEDAIQKFKEILRLLDVAPAQVEIKAEFIQVSTSEAKKMGIDWSLQRLNESFQTQFTPTGNVTYGLAVGNLTAQLKAELTNSVGRLINSPIISTTNNMDAYISIGKEIPYWTSASTTTNGVTSQTYTVDFITIDTSLEVTPRVNGDGSITMYLIPSVNGQGTDYKGPDGTLIPEQNTQELETERRVQNGETIVVGGLITKKENSGYQRVPLLADLPFIGSLFRTEDSSNQETELLIFITPTIIRDKAGFSAGTTGAATP